ncbi:hypothetical protein AXW84_11685 [Hymenobacter sp. PAMC 26628]|nr:hypothetical protein AXW84_11685 [Hymenobacter sp. PAMC 26628]
MAPSSTSPTGMPRASVNRLRLTPPLPRSVGLGPVFFSAQRRFVQRAVERHPRKIQPKQLVVVAQGLVPAAGKYAGLHPLLEPAVGGTALAQTGCIQRFPLAARAQNEEDGAPRVPVRDARPMAAQRVGLAHMRGQQGR